MALTKLNFGGSGQGALATSSMPSGSIIQTITMSQQSQVNSTFTTETTILTQNITPTFSDSKILISGATQGHPDGGTGGDFWKFDLYRDSTELIDQLASSMGYNMNSGARIWVPIHHIDSPNTTSQITYTVKAARQGGTAGNLLRVHFAGYGSITLYEIKV